MTVVLVRFFSRYISKSFNCYLVIGLLTATCFAALVDNVFDDAFYREVERKYGSEIVSTFKDWQELIVDSTDNSDWRKLNAANQFANRYIRFESDDVHWGKLDYWATPLESLGTGRGDCEDYAIFKYMTLVAMGMSEDKLRLMYVRALDYDQPHMVLIYFETPESLPLVLDNLNPKILVANRRPDLKPIYSFNGQGLWLAKAHGLNASKPDSKGTTDWSSLMLRIENGE